MRSRYRRAAAPSLLRIQTRQMNDFERHVQDPEQYVQGKKKLAAGDCAADGSIKIRADDRVRCVYKEPAEFLVDVETELLGENRAPDETLADDDLHHH